MNSEITFLETNRKIGKLIISKCQENTSEKKTSDIYLECEFKILRKQITTE